MCMHGPLCEGGLVGGDWSGRTCTHESKESMMALCALVGISNVIAGHGARCGGMHVTAFRPMVRSTCLLMRGGGAEAPALSADAKTGPEEAPCPKLVELRRLMADEGLQALVVPSDDPHLSEYPPPCFNRREFISGFTGSAGTAVITGSQALLWTDGRYFLQASLELSTDWTLMKSGQPDVPDVQTWLSKNLASGSAVGFDPHTHSHKAAEDLDKALGEAGVALKPTAEGGNLVDRVWGEGRPPMPQGAVSVFPPEWAGESAGSKLQRMRAEMGDADAMLVCSLDDLAWTLNVRGVDLPNTPVPFAYLVVLREEGATAFIDEAKVDDSVRAHLADAHVSLALYAGVEAALRKIAGEGKSVMLDKACTNAALVRAIVDGGGTVVDKRSPPMMAKSCKNDAELAGMREAHLRDSAALCNAFAWLEGAVSRGEALDEYAVGAKFRAFRAAQAGFWEESFPAIVGANGNGAIIHYRAAPSASSPIDTSCMVLIDSGGQYDCGTTDVTRTIHLGVPSDIQREVFTRVLKVRCGNRCAPRPLAWRLMRTRRPACEGQHRPGHRGLPRGHARLRSRRVCEARPLGGGLGLPPRHGPRGGCWPQRARGAAVHLRTLCQQGAAAGGYDRVQRAWLLRPGTGLWGAH